MTISNYNLIIKFISNKKCKNGSMKTFNNKIYSYNEIIGKKKNNIKTMLYLYKKIYRLNRIVNSYLPEYIIYNKTAKGNRFFSMTTSTHINKLINYLDNKNKNYEIINYFK